jgi:hypothetical protein
LESALNVDAGQFVSEFLVALGVVDVFAQLRSLCGGNPSTDVATIAPNLMLVVGADPASSAGIWVGTLTPLFGEGSWLHGGDGGYLIEQGFAVGLVR